jgi:hypothetical protein
MHWHERVIEVGIHLDQPPLTAVGPLQATFRVWIPSYDDDVPTSTDSEEVKQDYFLEDDD